MGQKVNPISLRLPATKDWESKWFGGKQFRDKLIADIKIRDTISKKLGFRAGVGKVEIERSTGQLVVTIFTSKPGVVIGRGGVGVEGLKKELTKLTKEELKLNIEEMKNPETHAQLIAENVASQLERRMAFRRVIKGACENAMKAGMLGAKITVSGRLNGAEMARRESTSQGSIPLHTIKANIDYGTASAQTTYGIIGVKVWIYKG